jgi:pantoate--beta-alanine ligase
MARELNVPIEVITCPIVREPDGLALSSRNRYLSEAERFRALSLSQSLSVVEREFNAGKRQASELERIMAERLRADVDSVDYAVVVNARTLSPFQSEIDDPAVALIAARVGATRLIDNRRLG